MFSARIQADRAVEKCMIKVDTAMELKSAAKDYAVSKWQELEAAKQRRAKLASQMHQLTVDRVSAECALHFERRACSRARDAALIANILSQDAKKSLEHAREEHEKALKAMKSVKNIALS